MKPEAAKILMVDDEPQILSAFRRTLGRTFQVTCAQGGAEGLAAIQSAGPFAVVVTDMTMPAMNGVQFITAARPKAGDAVFMMLTGNADQQTAAMAINAGHVFRFLNKPCPAEQLDVELRAALRHHELLVAEKTLLRDTVSGSIKLLADALELCSPVAMAYVSQVKRNLTQVAGGLSIPLDWQLTIAGSLSLIGLITIPGLASDQEVTDLQLEQAATVGSRLIGHIPRLAGVAGMIAKQREPGDLPADLTSLAPADVERLGAQLLRFCVDLARNERLTDSRQQAVGVLTMRAQHDRRMIDVLRAAEGDAAHVTIPVAVAVKDLTPGMSVEHDVRTASGMLLISRGQILSDVSVTCLRNFSNLDQIGSTVIVRTDPRPVAMTGKAA
jgi:CheY-like chemotaxis protein